MDKQGIYHVIMLGVRLLLAFTYLLLSYRHFFIPEVFRRTLELPVEQGFLFSWLYRPILSDLKLFTWVRFGFASLELILGLALLVGFLPRLIGWISVILLSIIILGLIPSWFMVFVHSFSLILAIPLVMFDATLLAIPDSWVPTPLMKWQRPT